MEREKAAPEKIRQTQEGAVRKPNYRNATAREIAWRREHYNQILANEAISSIRRSLARIVKWELSVDDVSLIQRAANMLEQVPGKCPE
jgi:hypothetical protein